MPIHWPDTPNRKLLRLRKDSDTDLQLHLNSALKADENAHLTLPDGWSFELRREGNDNQRGRVFAVLGTAGHTIGANLGAGVFSTQTLAYPHIRSQTRFAKVSADIAGDTGSEGLRIGWIDGVDEAHHWADQLGARSSSLMTKELSQVTSRV